MRLNNLIRILISIALLVVGTLFADGYKDPLYFYWLITLGILLIYLEFITGSYENIKNELAENKNKVSTLLMLKSNKSNAVQMSIFPKDKIIVDRETKIDLFVTCAVPITIEPNIKLLTNTDWEVFVSNQPQEGKVFASRFEYILINPLKTIKEERFIQYSFFIKIKNAGKHDFTVEFDNGTISGELNSTMTVFPL